ncbi:hypothetical protein HYH02_009041 [Chlamydomonas schloesseri]|uniref:Ankyrin repeat domain-containing protein n=1 Tax=Chlamydomonas schloesseri TaxID=2026947 RepID=A0A836B0Z2_9CHLO|nr:hypothetical protein HYH02_009041 [Chlamydomonas schloesseri]|eukprot:KAG2444099.1 hypothetical protein HYH02_009041 [Chlamydomonas schloesseri]
MKTDSQLQQPGGPSAAYTPRPPLLVPPASAAPEGLLPLHLHQHHSERVSPRQQPQAGHGSSSSSVGLGSGSSGGMQAAGVSAEPLAVGGSSSGGGGGMPLAAVTMGGGGGGGGIISTNGDVVLGAAATRRVAAAVGVAGAADPNGRFVWGAAVSPGARATPQRTGLLCAAAHSGHDGSLVAALERGGVDVSSPGCGGLVLEAAAAAGNVTGCQRLLQAGCPLVTESSEAAQVAATAAAVRGGHQEVLQLLLMGVAHNLIAIAQMCSAAAVAACAGGHPSLLVWLQERWPYRVAAHDLAACARAAATAGQADTLAWLCREHGYQPTTDDAVAAAEAGQWAVLEELLLPPLQRELMLPDADVAAAGAVTGEWRPPPEAWDVAAERSSWERRSQLLVAIAQGCPVEVLQRHYDRLWLLHQRHPYGTGPGDHPGVATQLFTGPGAWRHGALLSLLVAAAGSGTGCWAAKVAFLLERWGPAVARGVLQHLDADRLWSVASAHPDFLQRVQVLAAAGMRVTDAAVAYAMRGGHVGALAYLLDELAVVPPGQQARVLSTCVCVCAVDLPACPAYAEGSNAGASSLPVIQFAAGRGLRFHVGHLAGALRMGAPDESLVWLAEHMQDVQAPPAHVRCVWAALFSEAARLGRSLAVLRALRARGGADIDLAAVAEAGGEEALQWCVQELWRSWRLPKALTAEQRNRVIQAGNKAALKWLHARGLLRWRTPLDWAWDAVQAQSQGIEQRQAV